MAEPFDMAAYEAEIRDRLAKLAEHHKKMFDLEAAPLYRILTEIEMLKPPKPMMIRADDPQFADVPRGGRHG